VDGLDVSIILNGWIKSNPLTFFFVWWMDWMDMDLVDPFATPSVHALCFYIIFLLFF